MNTVLLVGFGAMGRSIYDQLKDHPGIGCWCILERDSNVASTQALLRGRGRAISSLDQLPARVAFAVECAGHEAIRTSVPQLLERGIDTIIASVGALALPGCAERLAAACSTGGSQLTLVPGALAGVDALAAAKASGLDSVTYSGRKPPLSWQGTAAEQRCDLANLTQATTFFTGTAREAAATFPQNANVAAMVGLAGMGLDRTQVELIADPQAGGNTHTISARGAFGKLDVCIEAYAFEANPKTSALAGMSIVRAVRNRLDSFVI